MAKPVSKPRPNQDEPAGSSAPEWGGFERPGEAWPTSNRHLEAVARIGAMANSTLDLERVLDRILVGTLDATCATVGMIFLRRQDTGELEWGASKGLSQEFIESYTTRPIQPGEGLTGRIAATGEPIYIDHDSSSDPRVARPIIGTEQLNSFIGVPIRAGDEIVAVMNVLTRPPERLARGDIALIAAIGTHVGSAIRNARLFEERVRAEEERQKLQAQLAQSQKMETVGRLAGGIAHDFNNMLAVIQGNAELVMKILPPVGLPRTLIGEILEAAQRSADLTRQLLAFARKQTARPEVITLNETVESQLSLLRRVIGENIELVWRPGHGLWPVRMDPSQVHQLLTNLCVNARDAIDGVGRITIETGTLPPSSPEGLPGDSVTLTVRDSGRGMDAQVREHIFEPFFTTKDTRTHSGLGLSLVYGIVTQNHGTLRVESTPGQGAVFTVQLPRHISGPDPQPPSPQAEVASAPLTDTCILLVEDEPSVLRLMTLGLEESGFRILAAGTPGEAIRLATQHGRAIGLLLTDVIMPEMNGRELAARLLPLCPDLRVLYMSGYPADVIATHGLLEQGIDFIGKPFAMTTLMNHIHRVLGRQTVNPSDGR